MKLRQPALRDLFVEQPSLPATEQSIGRILTLPCFPEMTEDEIARICSSLARLPEARANTPDKAPLVPRQPSAPMLG
jgi:dTDP-4-amino-4,6-dideoxygalactose transaminase